MLAIQRLSPHPLPGLLWLSLFLLAAGLTDAFSPSRFRRATRALGVLAIFFGVASLIDIARPHHASHPTAQR